MNIRFSGMPAPGTVCNIPEKEVTVRVKTVIDETDQVTIASQIKQHEPSAVAPFSTQTRLNVSRAQVQGVVQKVAELAQKLQIALLKPAVASGHNIITEVEPQDFGKLEAEMKKEPWFKSINWSKSLA